MKISPIRISKWVHSRFNVKSRKNGEELTICNPFDGDTGWHFNISTVKGICNDWRGNEWAGNITHTGKRNCSFINFVSLFLKCSIAEARKSVTGVQVNSEAEKAYLEAIEKAEADRVDLIKLPERFKLLSESDDSHALMCKVWLRKRGYDNAAICSSQLHYRCLDVLWPYFEFGEFVYWQTRNVSNKRFEFPDSAVFTATKGDFLYGFDNVSINEPIFITEAIFCANSIGQNSMASGGAELTDRQINKLKFYKNSLIVLALDNDKAGLKSCISNNNKLQANGFKTAYVIAPKIESNGTVTKDWNDLTVNKWDQKSIYDYCMSNLIHLGNNRLTAMKGIMAVKRLISQLP